MKNKYNLDEYQLSIPPELVATNDYVKSLLLKDHYFFLNSFCKKYFKYVIYDRPYEYRDELSIFLKDLRIKKSVSKRLRISPSSFSRFPCDEFNLDNTIKVHDIRNTTAIILSSHYLSINNVIVGILLYDYYANNFVFFYKKDYVDIIKSYVLNSQVEKNLCNFIKLYLKGYTTVIVNSDEKIEDYIGKNFNSEFDEILETAVNRVKIAPGDAVII
jgi:hypothetical protein